MGGVSNIDGGAAEGHTRRIAENVMTEAQNIMRSYDAVTAGLASASSAAGPAAAQTNMLFTATHPAPAPWAPILSWLGALGLSVRSRSLRQVRGKWLAPAGVATALVAAPAYGAVVIPVTGTVSSLTLADAYNASALDRDEDAWLLAPTNLSASSTATVLPSTGGVAGVSHAVDAGWVSASEGTVSVDSQFLFVVPDNLRDDYYYARAKGDFPVWTYRFRVTEDMVFRFGAFGPNAETRTGNAEYVDVPGAGTFGTLFVNGFAINISPSPLPYRSFALDADQDYFIQLYNDSIYAVREGNAVINVNQNFAWSITAPSVDPGGGEGGTPPAGPEPASWSLMLLGFGAVGWSIRRRPHTIVRYNLV